MINLRILFDEMEISIPVIFILSIIGMVLIVVVVTLIVKTINKKKDERVLETSSYIAAIQEINQKYIFEKIRTRVDSTTFYLKSLRQYSNFKVEKHRDEYIRKNIYYYEDLLSKLDYNKAELTKYSKELSEVRHTNDENLTKANKMSLKDYVKRETVLGAKMVKHPPISYKLIIHYRYTSPAGQRRYSNQKEYSIDEFRSVIEEYPFPDIGEICRKQPAQNPKETEKTYYEDGLEDA